MAPRSASKNAEQVASAEPAVGPFGMTARQVMTMMKETTPAHELVSRVVDTTPPLDSLVPGELNKTPWLGPMGFSAPPLKNPIVPVSSLVDIPGKGKGLVAVRNLSAGEVIFLERPFLRFDWSKLPRSDTQRAAALKRVISKGEEEDVRAFYSLYVAEHDRCHAEPLGIVHTNAMALSHGQSGVFIRGSRFNHSCRNNVSWDWIEEEDMGYFIACRDVQEGEELCISYVLPSKTKPARQDYLEGGHGFRCTCQFCSLPPFESKIDDRARTEIVQISTYLDSNPPLSDFPLKYHQLCCRAIQLLRERDIVIFKEVELANRAYAVCVLYGCRPLAGIWIQELVRLTKRSHRVGSTRYKSYEVLAEDVTTHPAWGYLLEQLEKK